MTLRGRIVGGAPVIYGRARNGRLYLGPRGDLPLIIDTGFSGALALPPSMTRWLNCQFVAVDTYTLATDVEVELPLYVGSVQIGARRVETWFVVGDALIGMELLQQVCSYVHI